MAEPKYSISLMQKIAILIDYLDRVHRGTHGSDTEAFHSYMDDAEVQNFLDTARKIGIPNNRFTEVTRNR